MSVLLAPETGMPRQVRIEFAGAIYHVTCRGDRRRNIYADDDDRRMFLATLAEAVQRTGWQVHGYVLMRNHYHLIIETPEPNLVRGMSWVQTTFTVRSNARHRTSGRLFGGRYKAVLVDPVEPRYLATLLDYIHLNPVRAGLVRLRAEGRLLDYPWSSLRGYVRQRERPPWLAVERGFAAKDLADSRGDRRRLVEELERRACADAAKRAGWSMIDEQNLQSTLRRGWYYGRERFRDWLLAKRDALLRRQRSKRKKDNGVALREHGEAEALQIIAQGLRAAKLARADLPRLPKGDPRKAQVARQVRARTTVPLQWIAQQLSMGTASNIAQACRRLPPRADSRLSS